MTPTESCDLVSIVTPTYNRPESLPLLWQCVVSQTWANIEWLVDDDSAEPSQFMLGISGAKVRYVHHSDRRSIGSKRNSLVAASKGIYIVHFDDDDFYSPRYVAKMISSMTQHSADLCKLSGFFLFYKCFGVLAYWDLLLKHGLHFRASDAGLVPIAVTEQNNAGLLRMHLGFGFSYVYKRAVWDGAKFKDIDMHEDETFMVDVSRTSASLLLPDTEGLCLHVIHGSNTSQCFPQYVLPSFIGSLLFASQERSFPPRSSPPRSSQIGQATEDLQPAKTAWNTAHSASYL